MTRVTSHRTKIKPRIAENSTTWCLKVHVVFDFLIFSTSETEEETEDSHFNEERTGFLFFNSLRQIWLWSLFGIRYRHACFHLC